MSIDFFAAKLEDKTWEPVFDFASHNAEILAPDADARSERGEDPFLPNPAYIEDAGVNMANGNAYFVLEALGLLAEDTEFPAVFPIADVKAGISAWLRAGGGDANLGHRVDILERIALKGEKEGATHLAAC